MNSKKIGIVGFGKIGQGIAANMLRHDQQVIAVDVNVELIEEFKNGKFKSPEPGVQEIFEKATREQAVTVSADFPALQYAKAILIAVPLTIDKDKTILQRPFLDCLDAVSPFLLQKKLVVVETTVPVDFFSRVIIPHLEKKDKKHGKDYLLAHSPERIKSGNMLRQLETIPKLIGGCSVEAADRAAELYANFFDASLVKNVRTVENAAFAKLAGMIYRDVNIALSNQLAMYATKANINFADLLPGINSDGEAQLLQPGIGVAGHCTPVYPYFMMEDFDSTGLDFTLAKQSRLLNDQMAAFAVTLLPDGLDKKNALILGLGFRPGVKEDANSITYLLRDELEKKGFTVHVHDPCYTNDELIAKGFTPGKLYAPGTDVVLLVTMHDAYKEIDFNKLAVAGITHLIDGRNVLDKETIKKAGIQYTGIGR